MISYFGRTKAIGDLYELRGSLEGHYGQAMLKLIRKRRLNPNARRDQIESPKAREQERRTNLDDDDQPV